MSGPEEGDRFAEAPHPRSQSRLFGHGEAEATVLAAWRAGAMPHAWILGGPEGIGKATLAYRVARFVLAGGVGETFDVPPDHPAARKVAALSHPDLLVLRRVVTPDRTTLPAFIPVDEVRKTVAFLGATAAGGGWRVVIVDSLDEMNAAGANALLKSLEEPPPRTLFLLIAHRPGRALPTIRSRCRMLMLRPLPEEDLRTVLTQVIGLDPQTPALSVAIAAAGGSVRRALVALDPDLADLRRATAALLAELPRVDDLAAHGLADRLAGGGEGALDTFVQTVEDWLAAPLAAPGAVPAGRLAAHAEVWDKVARAAAEVDTFHLDRKPFVFSVLSSLAEAARRVR